MKMKKIFLILISIFILLFSTTLSFATDEEVLNIESEAAILIEAKTGKVLYGKNEEEKLYPASTTKILTAILALENCNLTDTATANATAVSNIPSGYTTANIQIGETFTIEHLLKLLLVISANDAANVLAEHISGSIESFASMMNSKAYELGCTNTHFTNPSGMHSEDHYTTAHDLAIIMQYCIKNSKFRELASIPTITTERTNMSEPRVLINTNHLLRPTTQDYYSYAIASKTGFTTPAKQCLVSAANKDGLELICVVLRSSSTGRYTDTISLFEYGYDNYLNKNLRSSNSVAEQIEVINGTKETRNLDLIISEDINVFINKSQSEETFTPTITLKENLSAPIAQGDVVGKIEYDIDGVKYSADLTASHNVEKNSNIGLALIVLIIIVFLLYKLSHPKKKKRRKH